MLLNFTSLCGEYDCIQCLFLSIMKKQRKTQGTNLAMFLVPVVTQQPPIPIPSWCRPGTQPQLNAGVKFLGLPFAITQL